MKNMKAKAIVSLILVSVMAVFLVSSIAPVNAQSGSSVTIYATIGGTTNPQAGTTDTSGTLVLTATPDPGYQFAYWVYQGPDTTGHSITGLDTVIYTDNPLSIECAAGYAVEFQAVFLPTGSAYLPSASVNLTMAILAVALVAALVGAVAFVAGRRLKK